MNDDPKPSSQPPTSTVPYVLSVVILVVSGLVFSAIVIWLRPQYDPLVILGGVMGVMAPTIAAVLAYLKAQETHLKVNSRLDAFMAEHGKSERAIGVREGAAEEQNRNKAKTAPESLSSVKS